MNENSENEQYIDINTIAKLKGLKSTRSLRLEINKPNSKYIAREIKVNGGTSYEILYASLEPEIQRIFASAESRRQPSEHDKAQKPPERRNCNSNFVSGVQGFGGRIIQDEKLDDDEIFSRALVPYEEKPRNTFVAENARLTAYARIDIIYALENIRKKYPTKKEADNTFLEMYNSGMYLPKVFKFIGTISIGTLHRWVKAYEDYGTEALVPKRRYSKENEYNTKLTKEMQDIFLKYLLHPNKFSVGKAIVLTKHILEKRGIENIPCTLTFRRFAEHYQKTNYAKWVLFREGEKAFHDKVEQYLVRDISKLEVGDVLIADGHDLNFLVINPFTGKPARAVLVGFLDWKSEALVGYEIMMSENTQCIASALRNSIINLGMIPKVVYQDNGRAFKAKYFQHTDFDEAGFNGVYSNLGIKSVFAQSHNARAKVIERFFKEFQEEFEKMMATYIGTSIEDKPAWMKQGEKLHKNLHQKITGNYVPTIEETIIYLNCWLDFYNSKPCPNNRNMTIKECLNTVQKQDIDINKLDYLMMKSEVRTIIRSGITFLGLLYRNEMLMDYREKVFIRYSLFDLTKIFVYSLKGEFLCTAYQVEKVHPMAEHLGTVTDMEQFRQQIKKQKEKYNKVKKEFLKYHPDIEDEVLEIKTSETIPQIEEFKPMPKPKRERKLTLREKQMQRPLFESDYEKYEWLKENGCTNFEDRRWMTEYMKSDEYKNLYGDNL